MSVLYPTPDAPLVDLRHELLNQLHVDIPIELTILAGGLSHLTPGFDHVVKVAETLQQLVDEGLARVVYRDTFGAPVTKPRYLKVEVIPVPDREYHVYQQETFQVFADCRTEAENIVRMDEKDKYTLIEVTRWADLKGADS